MEESKLGVEPFAAGDAAMIWLLNQVGELLGESARHLIEFSALNFFELGLDSIRLVQLHDAVNRHFGLDVSILELIEYPSIAQYGMRLGQLLKEESGHGR